MLPKLNRKLEDPLPPQFHMTTAFAWILTVSLHLAYTCTVCKEVKRFVTYSDFGNVCCRHGLYVVIVDFVNYPRDV